MIHIDHYAYCSRLRDVAPGQKIAFTMSALALCLVLGNPYVSAAVTAVMALYCVRAGGVPALFFLKLMCLPGSFLLIGVATVLLGAYPSAEGLLAAWPVGGWWIGLSAGSLALASGLFLKALGSVSCLYGLSLTTPMVAVLAAVRRMGLPALLTDLMGLTYRFIFVLLDCAAAITTAQQARLGYAGVKAAYRSFGMMLMMVLVKALKQSDQLYTALESRGYQGELQVLEDEYRRSRSLRAASAAVPVMLVVVWLFSGR